MSQINVDNSLPNNQGLKESGVFKWIKFIFGFLFILGGIPSIVLIPLFPTAIIEIGSFTQTTFLMLFFGIYLFSVRNKKGFPYFLKIFTVLIIIFISIFVYTNFSVAKKINKIPADINFIQDESYVYNGHQIKWGEFNAGTRSYEPYELGLIDLNSGDVYQVTNKPKSVALGGDFAVWVAESGSPEAVKDEGGYSLEFDVWKYDFNTKQKTLLLERFDNRLNPNITPISVFGRELVLSTFNNELIFINVDTKDIKKIPVDGGYVANHGFIYFFENKVILPVWEEGTYHTNTFLLYDVDKNIFNKIYNSNGGYGISGIKSSNDGKVYWEEHTEWMPTKYYMIELQ